MNLRKKVQKHNLYKEYVDILNGILRLSKREVEVFSFLLSADANGEYLNINTKSIRNIIKKSLGISESNLSLYLSTLKKLSLIVKSEDHKWVINDAIRPGLEGGLIEVTVTLEVDELSR